MVEIDIKVLIGRLNPYCKRALETSAGTCVSRTNYEVTVEHLLHAFVEDTSSDIRVILKHFGVDAGALKKGLLETIEQAKTGNASRPVFSPILMEWFKQGWSQASLDLDLGAISSGVLLLTLLSSPSRYCVGDYLELLETISAQALKEQYADLLSDSPEAAFGAPAPAGASPSSADGSALARFTVDFTQKAREGKIDPVFGRDREIRQMIDILARRRKNNPMAVGEPGVGKTAVVEGLALRIVEGDVPDVLANVALISLDMGLLQAGASVKGEFENRLKGVIEEIKASPTPIVLFIDEAHTLIGAGGAAGGGDAANLLKPALARGELRTVAATTWSEYKKYFEKDAALARRFQVVKLDEPSVEVTITMLRGLARLYEKSHGVLIRDEAVVAAAELGSRYISGRNQPDKGVDLVDTSAARVKIALTTKPPELQDLERTLQTLERELKVHERDQLTGGPDVHERIEAVRELLAETEQQRETLQARWELERAAAEKVIGLRQALKIGVDFGDDEPEQDEAATKDAAATEDTPKPSAEDLQEALDALRELQGRDPMVPIEVTADVVAQVVANWTGIPLGKMIQDQAATLLAFEKHLGERIKGQDQALEVLGKGFRSAKAGLKDPSTPIGVYLFVGPSGVGKTETALGVADLMFGGERFTTTVNMSEFQEKHTVSRLIGSPPGYVGYGEGGMLTEAVRQHPYSVVLLDEVEKADRDVMNLFYQVFDKGMLSDGEGREINFKDTVIFMTTNLATDEIMQACPADGETPDLETLVATIRPLLSAYFKPALLARMTIVPFYPLRGEILKDIARLKLAKVQRRLMQSHQMEMLIDDGVVDAIAARCTEVETGARNVDHIIAGSLLPQISTALLEQMGEDQLPAKLTVKMDEDGQFGFEFSG